MSLDSRGFSPKRDIENEWMSGHRNKVLTEEERLFIFIDFMVHVFSCSGGKCGSIIKALNIKELVDKSKSLTQCIHQPVTLYHEQPWKIMLF